MTNQNIQQQLVDILHLTLLAIERPELRRVALKRGREVLIQVTGQGQVLPDNEVCQLLKSFGVAEPVLSELSLTATASQAEAWIAYCQHHQLGVGFLVMQLRSGNSPPTSPPQKTWFTPEEADTLFVR